MIGSCFGGFDREFPKIGKKKVLLFYIYFDFFRYLYFDGIKNYELFA